MKDAVSCLRDIFQRLQGMPPQLPRVQYRADHADWMDVLDTLEQGHQLLKSDEKRESYRLSPYALLLIDDTRSEQIIKVMREAYKVLKDIYRERPGQRTQSQEIIERIKHPKEDVLEALYYMAECHDVWTQKSNGFPKEPGSTIYIDERVLKRKDLIDVLIDYYRWHFINPKLELSVTNINSLFETTRIGSPGFFSSIDEEKHPKWFDNLGLSDRVLIIEVNKALQAGLNSLPIIGIRALIENTMLTFIEDKGKFKLNLEEFQRQGYITKKNAELLDVVIDAGSAVMHRSHTPSKEDVLTCIEVVKHLMQSVHILHPKVSDLLAKTPQKKQKKYSNEDGKDLA